MTLGRSIGLACATLLVCVAAAPAQKSPTRSDADRFVRELDNLFNKRDPAGYFDRFDMKVRRSFHNQMRHRIESLQLLKIRSSSKVRAFYPRGNVGVALVATKFRYKQRSLDLTTFTVFRRDGSKSTGMFSMEVDPVRAGNMNKHSVFTCPACNYEVRFNKDWLAVPVSPQSSGCMEALWLVSLRSNIYVEAAVHVGESAIAASSALESCVLSTRASQQIQETDKPRVTSWKPAAFVGSAMPPGMTCVRCVRHCKQGMVAEFNLVVMGRLRYLMVVRGTAADIERERAAIDGILKSFRLINPSLTAKAMAKRSAFAHTGFGMFDDQNTYTNKKYGIEITAPRGWKTTVRPGGWLFQLIFSCPQSDSRLSIRAIRPPANKWTRSSVNRVIGNCLRSTQRHNLSDSKWISAATTGGFDSRELRTAPSKSEPGDHVVRYAMRPDILLIMDGNVAIPAAGELISKAMRSLVTVK